MVIVTSDHGEQFGEHGGFRPRRQPVRVRGPRPAGDLRPRGRARRACRPHAGEPARPAGHGRRPARMAGHVSLPGIIARQDLGDAERPGTRPRRPAPLGTRGADRTHRREVSPRSRHSDPLKAIVDEGKVYIRHAGGREELYDIDADPSESLDLSASAGSGPILIASARPSTGSSRAMRAIGPRPTDKSGRTSRGAILAPNGWPGQLGCPEGEAARGLPSSQVPSGRQAVRHSLWLPRPGQQIVRATPSHPELEAIRRDFS